MTDLMNRRRALMGIKKTASRLPVEYQEVKWIGRDNNQPSLSFDFGNIGSFTMTIVIEHDAGIGRSASFVGRLAWSSLVNDYYVYFDSDTTIATLGDNVAIISASESNNQHTVAIDIHPPSSSGKFNLFKIHASTNAFMGKIYSILLEKDGTTLADLVPCYRKSDGEIGLFDIVSEQFFVNTGTGEFTKGADVK